MEAFTTLAPPGNLMALGSGSSGAGSFGTKTIVVLLSIFVVVFALTRALGALELGFMGQLLSLSVALMISAFVIQIVVKAPELLHGWPTLGFFSASLAASVALALYVHVRIYGYRL